MTALNAHSQHFMARVRKLRDMHLSMAIKHFLILINTHNDEWVLRLLSHWAHSGVFWASRVAIECPPDTVGKVFDSCRLQVTQVL